MEINQHGKTMNINKKDKVIVILGSTASGKTGLGVKLARELNGEIINADSRQVYKKMDIGTGKDLDEYTIKETQKNGKAKAINIPYHLIDIVHPNTNFNLSKYQKLAYKKIKEVIKKGKIPILVGGSGLYIQAVVENFNLSQTPPHLGARKELETKSENELFFELKNINPVFAEKLGSSDRKNKRRLVRYIEICRQQSDPMMVKGETSYKFLLLGVSVNRLDLNKKIYNRLLERLEKEGMIEEIRDLHKKDKVSWKRLKQFGLEYRYVSRYLQGELNYNDMVDRLYIAIRQFARRQMTWFRRWERQGADIYWIKDRKQAEKICFQ